MTTAPHDTVGPTGDALEAQLAEQRVVAQRALRSVLGISADEDDLVQEVLARLLVRLRQPGEIALSPWTWRVAHNVAVDHLRARRALPMDPVDLDRGLGDGLEDDVIASQLAAAVNEGLARLPTRQRDALVAQAALDGGRGGHALVAAELGVSPKAAESILARARHALRRELGEWVAAGAFVGWLARLLRRALGPKSLAVRAALIATVAVGGTGAVVAVAVAVATLSPGTSDSPSHASRSPAAAPAPGTTPAGPAAPAGALPPLTSLGGVPASVTLPALATVPSVTLPALATVPSLRLGPTLPSTGPLGSTTPAVTVTVPGATAAVSVTVPGVTVPGTTVPGTTVP